MSFRFRSNPTHQGDTLTWKNTEEDKIPIIDGKVSFHDEATGANYELYVVQVKGRGVADADKLVNLSMKHRIVLERLMNMGWDSYSAEQILKIVEAHFRNIGMSDKFKLNPYKRTISELFRRGLLSKDNDTPPRYTVDVDKSTRCLGTGKFE